MMKSDVIQPSPFSPPEIRSSPTLLFPPSFKVEILVFFPPLPETYKLLARLVCRHNLAEALHPFSPNIYPSSPRLFFPETSGALVTHPGLFRPSPGIPFSFANAHSAHSESVSHTQRMICSNNLMLRYTPSLLASLCFPNTFAAITISFFPPFFPFVDQMTGPPFSSRIF